MSMAVKNDADSSEKEVISSSDPNAGLTSKEAKDRLDRSGYNEVPEVKKSRLSRFAKKFWGIAHNA